MLRSPLVAREGWGWIVGAFALALLLQAQAPFYYALLGWLAVGALLWAFRDPPHDIPITRCAVLSPINGRITAVERCADPCLSRQAWHIQIQMGWLDVMSIFSPSEARVMRQTRPPAPDDPAKGRPRLAYIYLQTDDDDDILMVLCAVHPFFSRFACYAHIGERLGKGQRCGFCYLVCKVDLYLPENTRINIKTGGRVQAGTLLAELQRPATPPPAQLNGAPA